MERWRGIPGHEGAYQASDLGRVRSLPRKARVQNGFRTVPGGILKPGKSGTFGHVTVALGKGNSRFVHEIVLRTFVGPPKAEQECRHLDGNGSNNRLENLCWGSKSANGKDVTRLGRRKFTYEQADEIRKKKKQGLLLREIAEEYGCSVTLVHQIVTGFRYAPD